MFLSEKDLEKDLDMVVGARTGGQNRGGKGGFNTRQCFGGGTEEVLGFDFKECCWVTTEARFGIFWWI